MTATEEATRPATAWWSQRRNHLLAANWLTYAVNYLDRTKTAALLPLIAASFSLSTRQVGWFLFAFYISYAVAQPIAGYITDRLGARRTLALSVAAFTMFTWTIAFANGYIDLLVRNALFGLFIGFEYSAASRLIAVWFPARTRGRAHAVHQTGNTLGALVAPFIAVPVAEVTGSWRWAFIAISFLGLPLLALIHRYVFDRPEGNPRVTRDELVEIYGPEGTKVGVKVVDPTRATSASELPPGERPVSYREALLNRSILLLAAAVFFASFAVWGLASWLPTYGVEQLGLPLLAAGTMASVFWAGTILGTLTAGFLSDLAFARKRTPVWLVGGIAGCAAITAAALMPPGVPAVVLYVLFGLAGYFVVWSPLAVLTPAYIAELLTPGIVGRVVGFAIVAGNIGSAFAQPLAGALVLHGPDGVHYWPVFLAFGGSALCSALCCFGMVEPTLGRTYLGHRLSGRTARSA